MLLPNAAPFTRHCSQCRTPRSLPFRFYFSEMRQGVECSLVCNFAPTLVPMGPPHWFQSLGGNRVCQTQVRLKQVRLEGDVAILTDRVNELQAELNAARGSLRDAHAHTAKEARRNEASCEYCGAEGTTEMVEQHQMTCDLRSERLFFFPLRLGDCRRRTQERLCRYQHT